MLKAEWFQLEPENLYFNDNRGNKWILDRASLDVSVSVESRYNRFKAGHPAGFIEAFANYYSDIADLILDTNNVEARYVFGLEEALEGLKMLESMTKSNMNNGWEKI